MTQREKVQIIIVMPCFNEEHYLENSCASLGFGLKKSIPEDSIIVIINNNSTDATQFIAERIKANSPPNKVILGFEKIQGFVPARYKGNHLAKEVAQTMNLSLKDIFIVQADADTEYSENYISYMKAQACESGENILLEAMVDYPLKFKNKYSSYVNLCSEIDNRFWDSLSLDLTEDVIIDDKAVGYKLSDYFTWGCHKREYTSIGEEIYAETSRLFTSAKAYNAKRILVAEAYAYHSTRQILKNPLLHLSTAGFPRELSWKNKWATFNFTPLDLNSINIKLNTPAINQAIQSRYRHLYALFCLLPVHIANTLGEEKEKNIFLSELLPIRTVIDMKDRPGVFLTDVFKITDNHLHAIHNFS